MVAAGLPWHHLDMTTFWSRSHAGLPPPSTAEVVTFWITATRQHVGGPPTRKDRLSSVFSS